MLISTISYTSRNMGCLSLFWCLPQSLSSQIWSFHCTSLVIFVPRIFYCFDAVVNGNMSTISFLVCQLLVCRKAINFCKKILYPATLLNLLIISRSFLVEFFWDIMYIISYPLQIQSFIASFPVGIFLISFLYYCYS